MKLSSTIRKVNDRVSELCISNGFHFINNIEINKNFVCHGGKIRWNYMVQGVCFKSSETMCLRDQSLAQFLSIFFQATYFRSSHPEVFLGKGVLKIYSKFSGEHSYQSAISIITLWHGCSPVDLLHIFRRPFYKKFYDEKMLQFYDAND